MMKKLISGFMVLFLMMTISQSANAAQGDLFAQVSFRDLEFEACSIMNVTPAGVISQFISNAQILALTGNDDAECSDSGLAVGLDGTVFFYEQNSQNIFMATNPGGVLSIFVTEADIEAATGLTSPRIQNGMAISPVDGNLYVADDNNGSILRINVGGPLNGHATQIITEAEFEALVPGAEISLEGGIDLDCLGNIYITNDADGTGGDVIFKYTAATGVLSILSTEAQIAAATGSPENDLDVGVVFFDDLFVLVDTGCNCLIKVDPVSGDAVLLASEADINSATGNDEADVEGGLAIDQIQNLYIGDDGEIGGNGEDRPNIVQATQFGQTSLFASTTEIRNFYNVIEPGSPRLLGSMAIEGVNVCAEPVEVQVPTLSEWGLIAMAGILGIVGFLVMRRKKVSA